MRKKRRLVFYRVIVFTVVFVLVAEGAARIVHSPRVLQPRMGVYDGVKTEWGVPDYAVMARHESGHLINRYRPNITYQHQYDGPGPGEMEPGNIVTYRTNSWGFRDVDHEWAKPENTFRVLMLGDSFTWGEGTRFDQTYPQLLAQELKSRRIDGQAIEIVNMAIPGDDTQLEYETYYQFAEKIDPDLVIVQWNTNDFPVESVTRDHVKMIGVNYQRMYADSEKYQWSALVHLVWYSLRSQAISEDLIETTNREVERGARNFDQITEFSKWVTTVGDRDFAVVIFPELIRFEEYPYQPIVDGLVDRCRERKISCVNLVPALSKYRDSELWAHSTDHHPNHLAHRIASHEIMAFLEQHWLDER